ncbi:hypothetical protein QL285_085883 [Trifolium repens]|nr:hypothetical protein QL285_085883 [Trifolium repens]
MNRSQSFRYNQSPSIESSSGRHSVDSTIRINLAGVNFTPNIPQPIYQERMSRSPSPTESQVLGVITKEDSFIIDKEWIKEDFMAPYNQDKRKWYFDTFVKTQTKRYLELFYQFLEYHEINTYFFTWFELYCLDNNIQNPYAKQMFLDAKTRMSIKWKTARKELIESLHPPLETIKITPPKENIEIEASPFKIIVNPSDHNKDVNNVHRQLNYTNQILYTMSQQLDRVEQLIPETIEDKTIKIDPTRHIYKYDVPSQQDIKGLALGYNPEHKLEELVDKIKRLDLGGTSSRGIQLNTLSYDEYEESPEDFINRLGKVPKPKTRNYYPRPSFADVQFEERSSFIENSYSGDSIVEWNIDGVTTRFSKARKGILINFFLYTSELRTNVLNEPTFKYTKELITIRCFDKQSVFLNNYNPSLSIQILTTKRVRILCLNPESTVYNPHRRIV